MPIKADQLREKEDFQKLILERLKEDNKFRIRPNTSYKPGLAMDTEVLLEFLEDTQHDEMERLRRMYKDRTNDTVINYINSEINKESRGLRVLFFALFSSRSFSASFFKSRSRICMAAFVVKSGS